jgi:hypothetical protein
MKSSGGVRRSEERKAGVRGGKVRRKVGEVRRGRPVDLRQTSQVDVMIRQTLSG